VFAVVHHGWTVPSRVAVSIDGSSTSLDTRPHNAATLTSFTQTVFTIVLYLLHVTAVGVHVSVLSIFYPQIVSQKLLLSVKT